MLIGRIFLLILREYVWVSPFYFHSLKEIRTISEKEIMNSTNKYQKTLTFPFFKSISVFFFLQIII